MNSKMIRDQSKPINETERKRTMLISFSGFTHIELQRMSEDEIEKAYDDIMKKIATK